MAATLRILHQSLSQAFLPPVPTYMDMAAVALTGRHRWAGRAPSGNCPGSPLWLVSEWQW